MSYDALMRVEVSKGDLTEQAVDAIVNAANERMLGGGGVDGAIHRAAGPKLLEACKAVPEVRPGVRCPIGEARITPGSGFDLPAAHVIHTVGPRGSTPNREELLASAFRSSLQLATEHGLRTVAFPAISCGVFGYPPEEAAAVAKGVVDEGWDLDAVSFVLFTDELEAIFRETLG